MRCPSSEANPKPSAAIGLIKGEKIEALFREVFAGYELHYYLAIRAARCGFHVTEIPVTRSYPDHGPLPSKISPLRGNLRVLGCLFRACSGAYDP